MTKKKHAGKKPASSAFLRDLQAVVEKHNPPGTTVVIHALTSAADDDDDDLVADPSELHCQPPLQPRFVSKHTAGGGIESGWACRP